MTVPEHVAIVGCGFTGTTAVHQLVLNYPVRKITVYETDGIFGPGLPYRPDESRHYLINNTNDTMCLDPSDRRAFLIWLQGHPEYSPELDAKGHMPRSVYGAFLQHAIASARSTAHEKGIDVELIAEECLDIEDQGTDGVILTSDAGPLRADMAILASGRCPDIDVFGLEPTTGGRYFPTHMPGSKLDELPLDATVHVLGASLSAYDVVNQLFSPESCCEFVDDGSDRLRFVANGNNREVVLCSRSGRLKKTQSRNPLEFHREHFTADGIAALATRKTTIEQVFELMSKDLEQNGVMLDLDSILNPYADCQSGCAITATAMEHLAADIDAGIGGTNFVVDYLDQAQFDLWMLFAEHKLSAPEEARYRSMFESALLTYAAPCPISTAQKILALIEGGRLRVVKGLQSVRGSDNGYELMHEFGTEAADCVVNATGVVDRDVASQRQGILIRNLYRRALLRPYAPDGRAAAGADVDMRTFRCTGSRNIYAANMFLWGPGFFTSAAITMATVVRRLLDAAFGRLVE